LVYKHENTILEITWTILPTLLLLAISIPSLSLIWLITPTNRLNTHYSLNVKVLGSQWFWTYEIKDNFLKKINYNIGWINTSIIKNNPDQTQSYPYQILFY
jgi:heme/copper-type cytochrome/quinol oxidase subunit 2